MNYAHSIIIAAAIVAAAAVPSYAQTHPALSNPHEVTIINDGAAAGHDTVNVYNIFVENSPRSFHIPGAPRFAIMGSKGKFYLGIGGTAKATVSYDWGNPIENATSFSVTGIPDATRPGDGGLTQFSAQTSQLFVNFVALPSSKNQIGVYFNAKFNGEHYGLKVHHAYVKFRGILAGYNHSIFTDGSAAPATIDDQGPAGYTCVTNGVVDYIRQITPRFSVAAGLEKPLMSATTSDLTYVVNQRVPDIPFYIQYSWSKSKGWLRLSGIIRNLQYRDLVKDKNTDVVGWGVKLSGSTPVTPLFTAYYQAAYGKGIASYFQDLSGMNLDLMPDAGIPGKLSPTEAWGGYAALQCNISPKVFATVAYGHLRTYADNDASAARFHYGQTASANVFWRITPEVTAAMEYIYGRKVSATSDGGSLQSRHDNRIQAMLQVSF